MTSTISDWNHRPWGEPWKNDPSIVEAATAVTEIGMSRGMCYGPCPVYSVRLMRSNEAEFVGEHFVDLMGTDRAMIQPADFELLALAVTVLGFENLAANYAVDYTDASTTRSWIVRHGRRVQVEDYGGAGHDSLRSIEDLIDNAASQLLWRPVRPPSNDDDVPLFAGLSVDETWRPPTKTREDAHWTQARTDGDRPRRGNPH